MRAAEIVALLDVRVAQRGDEDGRRAGRVSHAELVDEILRPLVPLSAEPSYTAWAEERAEEIRRIQREC